MTSIPQPSWVFSLNAINGVSSSNSKTNLFPSTNLRTCPFRTSKVSASLSDSNAESFQPKLSDISKRVSEDEAAITDPVKLAFERAKLYKKSIQSDPIPKQDQNQKPVSESVKIGNASDGSVSDDIGGDSKEIPVSVKLAMEKAREYKKNKGGVRIGASSNNVEEKGKKSGLEEANVGKSRDGFVEKRVGKKKEESTISSINFVGLNFSDKKKSRGLPAGLVPIVEPFPEGDLPEVEVVVGDISKFGAATPLKPETTIQDDSDIYKPKVSTWGVFPRPSNISKTFGGGRVLRPGEVLETAEDKAVKDARTRQLLASYKNQMGLTIDPELKSKCEKALKDGDYFMDVGKLKEALPYYEKVMKELAFQNELHGLAALQWSICQDSLSRGTGARNGSMGLQPNPQKYDFAIPKTEYKRGVTSPEQEEFRQFQRTRLPSNIKKPKPRGG